MNTNRYLRAATVEFGLALLSCSEEAVHTLAPHGIGPQLALEIGKPVPSHVIVTHNDLEWVWASPCLQGGCTTGINVGHDGFVYATPAQWALRPPARAFVGKCAAPWFDQTHDQCDLADWVTSAPFISGQNRRTWDTMLVRVTPIRTPLAKVVIFPHLL